MAVSISSAEVNSFTHCYSTFSHSKVEGNCKKKLKTLQCNVMVSTVEFVFQNV